VIATPLFCKTHGNHPGRPNFVNQHSWARELSSFLLTGQRKYLWGIVPAVDILNVAQNAGANISLTLYLLFAGKKPHFFVWAFD
jgi:hypothetical protein